mmetsp:Transcript_2751/g.4094  ORF Transcript_2751/g.4094 Transcript_2751/m.4094 type:complete len:107 (-) Transcript_2751:75-395(-)
MSAYPFTSAEMKAMAGVVQMTCVDETREMIEQRKQGLLTNEQTCNKVVDCWKSTNAKTTDKCGDQYQKLVGCISNNERRMLKCKELRAVLEECYVKNVMFNELGAK